LAAEEHINRLLNKYLQDTCTDQEYEELLSYFSIDANEENAKELLFQAISSDNFKSLVSEERVANVVKNAHVRILSRIRKPTPSLYRRLLPYAAAILFFISVSIGAYWCYQNSPLSSPATSQIANDVMPGGNRATLTLDGRNIELRNDQEGIVSGTELMYEDGTLIEAPKAEFATLTTPNGGQYQLTLPDGSKVWLNAASSLRYPTEFNSKERLVELTGEAFFEVAHDPSSPFVVETNRQHVKVLGTSFNLYAYNTEKKIITTLVQGSVVLSYADGSDLLKTQQLLPGQQSVLHDNGMQVKNVEIDQYISWKDGTFMLSNADLATFAQQIERWYDVELLIDSSLKEVRISGIFSRKANLSELLEAISENEKINFKIEGRRISMTR
jgi:transmembrane sensor